jgi:hypothetical protein
MILNAERFFQTNEIDQALESIKAVESLITSNNYRLLMLNMKRLRALFLLSIGNDEGARRILNLILKEAQAQRAVREEIRIYNTLVQVEKDSKDIQKAYEYLIKNLLLKTSIGDWDCHELILKYQDLFETENERNEWRQRAAGSRLELNLKELNQRK